jgi:arylsulfatase A-like enzyme
MVRRLDHRTTLQRYLLRAGYRTGIAGKFLNGWPLQRDPPFFHRWAITGTGDYYGQMFNNDGDVRRVDGYSTTFIRRRSAAFLRGFEHRDRRPWLLFVTPNAPHGPFRAERRYRRAPAPPWDGNPAVFEEDRSDKPPFVQESKMTFRRGRRLRKRQLRTLMSVDDLVGQLKRELGRLGERLRTLAVFVSDNGLFWGEHGLGHKRLPYTQAVGVPFMVRWPGHLPPGVGDDRLVANVDLAPTALHAAGLRRPSGMDGRSLLREASRPRLLLEHFRDSKNLVPTWTSLRTATYQYVEYRWDGDVRFREYYDLSADPWQLDNLLEDGNPLNDPDVASLHDLLARDRRCQGHSGARACP